MCFSLNKAYHYYLYFQNEGEMLYKQGVEYFLANDFDDAFHAFFRASKLGNANASNQLAQMFLQLRDTFGYNFSKHTNHDMHVHFIKVAAQQGHPDAKTRLKEIEDEKARNLKNYFDGFRSIPKPTHQPVQNWNFPSRPLTTPRPTNTLRTSTYKKTWQTCMRCSGTTTEKCSRCNYRGYVYGYGGKRLTCLDCRGNGRANCSECRGKGKVER